MNDHIQACEYCPKYNQETGECPVYSDLSWINRRGGCPMYPYRKLPTGMSYNHKGEIVGVGRIGQQKQKKR